MSNTELEQHINTHWLSRSQAANVLNRSGESVAYYARTGRLSFITTPLGALFTRQSVEALRDSQRPGGWGRHNAN